MNTMNDSMAPENVTYTLFPSSGEVFVANYQVTSMCLLSKLLFIGTSGGTVAQCVYEECGIYGGLFCYIQLITRTLSNSSITKMQTAASLNLLAILSQNDLFIYDAEKLEPVDFFQTCRGVSTFHLHPKEPECAELCLGFLSRSVQIYKLTRTGTNLSFECKLKVAPSLLCFGEQYLCVATEGQYISLNLHNKEVTELFRYNGARTKPFLAHLQKDEFLISGPGSLAVLVDARGLSQRPPFQLSPNVLELFIWHNYLFAVTDEFFTIHSILNQTQLQTVPLGFATSACFSPLDPHLIFVATTSQGSNKTDLAAIGPERWDHFVRKLILAGCHRQAQHILSREYQLMETLVQERPASSNGVRNIFTMRYRRVNAFLALYHFGNGDFDRSNYFFDRCQIDIPELLVRYEDLLPTDYHFQLDPFYRLNDQPGVTKVPELCLMHSMSRDGEPNESSNAEWMLRYDQFLFEFLQKHHKSKFAEKYLHFLETALVKLFVRLSKHGIFPALNELIIPSGRLDATIMDLHDPECSTNSPHSTALVDLISSLVHIDVEDLTRYLERCGSHHALALIYQWQGNLPKAVAVWQQLAYGQLSDNDFPGVHFYIAILRWLATSLMEPSSTIVRGSSDTPSAPLPTSVYSELVWHHYCEAIDSGFIEIAEKLLFALPHVPSNGSSTTSHFGSIPMTDPSLAPSQCLVPFNLVKRLIPKHLHLARRYLHHLIQKFHDDNPVHHDLLANIYLQLFSALLNDPGLTDSSMEYFMLRKEFCCFLRYSNQYSVTTVLDKVLELGRDKLPHEVAILHGKLGKHREALDILVNRLQDLSAALRYCFTYWYQDSMIHSNLPSECFGYEQPRPAAAPEIFTHLVEMCLERGGDMRYEEFALNLINCTDIPLDFSKLLTSIPGHIPVFRLKGFLNRAFRNLIHCETRSRLHRDLAKCCAIASAVNVAGLKPMRLLVDKATKCYRCHRELSLYGPDSPFAWLLHRNQVAHVHCIEERPC